MELTRKNRSLLRPRAAKQRGNPIFISSQPIPKSEPVPIIIHEHEPSTGVNDAIALEQSYSSIEVPTALTNKQSNTPGSPGETLSDFSEPGVHRPQFKRQRTNKYDEQESFVAPLPLFAIEKRLDFGLSCNDDKYCPCTMAVTGKIHPKKISLSVANSSSDNGSDQYDKMLFDATFNNKWRLGNISRDTSPEVENSSPDIRPCEDDEPTSEESNENQLRIEESSNVTENGDYERREREKRACKSVFDLVRLMELRRVGLVKPPKNPVIHAQLIEEIRKCTTNLRNKSSSNDGNTAQTSPIFETSPVVNQDAITIKDFEPTSVEDSCYTVEYNEEVASVDTTLKEVDTTSLVHKNNANDVSYERPILKRRVKQPNSWQDMSEKSKEDQEGVSFKDRLNPIAAAEYDEMDVIELDIYDELPNQLRYDMPKEFTRRWSAQSTEEFYKCIALLGLDFGRIATVMRKTQKQITNKFKIEQKKNNKRLHNALTRQGEFFEYRKKYRF